MTHIYEVNTRRVLTQHLAYRDRCSTPAPPPFPTIKGFLQQDSLTVILTHFLGQCQKITYLLFHEGQGNKHTSDHIKVPKSTQNTFETMKKIHEFKHCLCYSKMGICFRNIMASTHSKSHVGRHHVSLSHLKFHYRTQCILRVDECASHIKIYSPQNNES